MRDSFREHSARTLVMVRSRTVRRDCPWLCTRLAALSRLRVQRVTSKQRAGDPRPRTRNPVQRSRHPRPLGGGGRSGQDRVVRAAGKLRESPCPCEAHSSGFERMNGEELGRPQSLYGSGTMAKRAKRELPQKAKTPGCGDRGFFHYSPPTRRDPRNRPCGSAGLSDFARFWWRAPRGSAVPYEVDGTITDLSQTVK
jgi:hypothetical protein